MKKELLTVCTLMIATASFAAMPAKRFKSMDGNGDGQLTQAEYFAAEKNWFEKLDKNNDGFLVAPECVAGIIARNDKDKDGKMSVAEHTASYTRVFSRVWDKNKDGVINASDD